MAESASLIPLFEALRRNARNHPERDAYIWYGQHISWRQMDDASDAVAAHLQQLGVKKGEPVALFMNNCPQYIVAHYAAQKIGGIVCPCGPLNKEHELEYQLNDLQARIIIAADVLLPVVDKVRSITKLEHVLAVRYGDWLPAQPTLQLPAELQAPVQALPANVQSFWDVMHSGARPQAVALSMDDVALMTYTSGTTGLPKGAMLSFGSAAYKTAGASDITGVSDQDVLLAVAPLYHIAGMSMGVNMPVHSGAPCVLLHRFDPVAVAQAIERYRVTWWYSIAPMNVAIMQLPGVEKMDFSSLRRNTVTSFGITYTEDLAQKWRKFAPNAVSSEASYGLSETHTMDTYMPGDAIRWGTHGKPAPGNEIRVIDPETGTALAPNEVGEIIIRGPGNFKGYWNKPDATAKTLKDGWVHTGDMGKFDEDGYLTFIGRFKEMIKVSGYSVFPEEVETILIKHPAVAQAAVIGVPDPQKGEIVRAFIVCKPGQSVDADALLAWSKENMANYKAPREVRFIDALPATGAGKVLRRLLRDIP
ncbi:AMP-dependent synthetase [Comamonas testosteroni]|uniref:AMP-dependent synthetase n=1 Tax=Comamonas testosteroni TaxID=285 RepID=A0A373FP83_COMTE|nr:AMP-binding protein [Comamonas testosteroni]RGE45727.1 AMP-dependent synthetase [Comamonas testosteroni]